MASPPSEPTPLPARHGRTVQAAVLFADVLGFGELVRELGTETAYLVLTRCLRLLDGIARKHGGSVDKYQGDKLLAVFGYPVPVEQASRAAVSAALEMRERVDAYNAEPDVPLPLGVHIGVNTGPMVGGDIHGPVVREFHVLGDAVNTAARINGKAAPGQVLVGPLTHEETRADFAHRAIAPLRLKGKEAPVPAFEVIAARDRATGAQLGFDTHVFAERVGRDAELEALSGALDALGSGRGGLTTIRGEEGSGKSRLLLEVARHPALEAVAVWQARAGPAMDPLPEAGLTETDPNQPLLLVVEDAHRLDTQGRASLARTLTHASSDAPRAVRVVLTLRDDEPGAAEIAALAAEVPEARRHEITLGPLADAEARALAHASAPGDDLDPETLALVLERGVGNPGRILMASFLAPSLRSERAHDAGRERSAEAERRRASVLFADLSGFTAMTERIGAERAYPVVAAALDLLDQVAREHGGTVDHYLGDCVMALFGVPVALEDAPRAALNAALDMRIRLAALNEHHGADQQLELHCGVATGLGIAGDVSGPMIREFAVMGEHVDLADAITHAAATGEIHADQETRLATESVFEFGPERPLPDDALATSFELLSTAPRLHRARIGAERRVFSDLVGRDEEMSALRSAVGRAAAGTGGVASLVADAGIGKSRLLAELRGTTEAEGVTWLEGRALSTGRNLSFHPIADLLRAAAGVDDDDGPPEARAKLDAAIVGIMGEEGEDLLPLLAGFMGLPMHPGEEEQLAAMQKRSAASGDPLEWVIRAGLTRLLREASLAQPMVIVMEDVHWADLSTIELLEPLLRLTADCPILFVNAARPGYPDTAERLRTFAQEQLADRHTAVRLEPLDDGAARALVRNLFRGGDVPHRTRAMIEEKAQGNPFYIEEVVRALLDAGALVLREGAFHATERLDAFEMPGTVQEAVMARVDRLPLAPRQVLQAASVVGGTFHQEVLEDLVDDPAGLESCLGELEAGEFIEPTDRTAGIEFGFVHPLIQEVTYDALLQARRVTLHQQVARATEARLDEGVPGYHAMLAYHFSMGRDTAQAEKYLLLAGDEAARNAASSEALRFFQQAAELFRELHGEGGDPRVRARIERNLGLALFNRGQEPDSAVHFDEALTLLGVRVPKNALALNGRFLRDVLAVVPPLFRNRTRKRPPASDDDRELIDISFFRALSQSTAEPTRFVFDSMSTLRRVARFDPRSIPEAGGKYAGAAAIFSYSGLSFAVSQRFLAAAGRMIQREDAADYLYYRVIRFVHHFLSGDWDDAHEIPEEIVRRSQRDGRLWEVTTYLGLLGEKRLRQGDFEGVHGCTQWIQEIADTYEYDVARYNALGMPVILALEQRRLDDAGEAARRYQEESPQELLHLLALGWRAEAAALRGELESAESALGRADQILEAVGRAIPFHRGSVDHARLLCDVCRIESEGARIGLRRRARKSARAASRIAPKIAYRMPQVLRLEGRLDWLAGRRQRALRSYAGSLEAADRMGLAPERARTAHELSLRLSEAGGKVAGLDAQGLRDDAQERYETLGLAWDLDQLQAGRNP